MDIGLTVNCDALILWQLFTPGFTTETVDCPVITVKAAPQNSAAILIYKLLGSHRIVEALDVHHAYGIVFLAADGHLVASNNIHHLFGGGTGNDAAAPGQQALGAKIHFVTAVVLAKSPVVLYLPGW